MDGHKIHDGVVCTRIHDEPPIYPDPHEEVTVSRDNFSQDGILGQPLAGDQKPVRTFARVERRNVTAANKLPRDALHLSASARMNKRPYTDAVGAQYDIRRVNRAIFQSRSCCVRIYLRHSAGGFENARLAFKASRSCGGFQSVVKRYAMRQKPILLG
jgi:hypothetical protein